MLTKRNLRPTPPKLLEVRPLTPDDLRVLTEGRGQKQTVAKLRDSHHRVARLIAAGLRYAEVAEQSGYSLASIYRFVADPACQELIALYRRDEQTSAFAKRDQVNAVAFSNMLKMEREIADRLDDDEVRATISFRDLNSGFGERADRFGYGKRSTQVNVNVDMGTALEKARERYAASRTIEGTAVLPSCPPTAPDPTLPSGDSLDRRGM